MKKELTSKLFVILSIAMFVIASGAPSATGGI